MSNATYGCLGLVVSHLNTISSNVEKNSIQSGEAISILNLAMSTESKSTTMKNSTQFQI